MSLERLPIYRALHQPILLGGAERSPAIMLATASVGVAMNGMTVVALSIGLLLWFVGFPLLRLAAKSDPKMIEVYRRSTLYRGYYPPRSTPWRTR